MHHIDHRIPLLAAPFVVVASLCFAHEAAVAYMKASRGQAVEAEQLVSADSSQLEMKQG